MDVGPLFRQTIMHLLLSDEIRTPRSVASTVVSALLHAGLVVVVVLSGRQVASAVTELFEQTVQYLYPVPRDIGAPRPGIASDATGAAARALGNAAPRPANGAGTEDFATRRAHTGIEYAPMPLTGEAVEPGVGDNAFSVVDVDSVATVDPTSVAPEYPASLAQRRVEGGATFRFVIDSTGLVDMSTVRLVQTSHKLFAQAVVDAMPRMKYRAARVGARAVRLLVEQSFSFKIQKVKGTIS